MVNILLISKKEHFRGKKMTSKDKGHFAKKHSPDRKVNPSIADAVKHRAPDGEIPCAVAFEIAETLKATPEEVGFTVDSMEVKVIKCQLGLFGYLPNKRVVKPAQNVASALKEAIEQSLIRNRLSCKAAWEIAARFGLRKMEVSSACEALGIKISSCQLGTF
jgi:hypothetical protein